MLYAKRQEILRALLSGPSIDESIKKEKKTCETANSE